MVELQEIFNINYGTKLDMNKMSRSRSSNIAFVSRSSKNNGVVAHVDNHANTPPLPPGLITVTLGGTYVLSSFLQETNFYTAQNVAVLENRVKLTKNEKLYYCLCIRNNRFRYSAFGREANRTLKKLLVPSIQDIPRWVNKIDLSSFDKTVNPKIKTEAMIPTVQCHTSIGDLFTIENGVLAKGLNEESTPFEGSVAFIRPASTFQRTLRSYIPKKLVPKDKIFPAGTLFISTNGEGSHTYSYVSIFEFVPNSDVSALIPKGNYSAPLSSKLFSSGPIII